MAQEKKVNEPRNEKYHLDVIRNLMSERFTAQNYRRMRIGEAYEYFINDDYTDPYEKLINHVEIAPKPGENGERGEEGVQIPYIYSQFKKLRTKIKTLEGELQTLGFKLAVEAINKDAKFERQRIFKEKYRLKLRENERLMLAQNSGIMLGLDASLPETMEELMYEKEKGVKLVIDIAMGYALNNAAQYCHYKLNRLNSFRDVLIAGECHSTVEYKGAIVTPKRVNPMFYFPDIHQDTDEIASDSVQVLEAKYLGFAEVAATWDIEEETLQEWYESYKAGSNREDIFAWKGVNVNDTILFQPFVTGSYHTAVGTAPRILVVTAEWEDIDPVAIKSKELNNGAALVNTYYEDANEYGLSKKDKKFNAVREVRYRKVRREATLIAGTKMVDWGVKSNQTGLNDYPTKAPSDYVSYFPYITQGKTVSLVMELQVIESYRNFILTKMQHEIAKSPGNGIAIDIAGLDPDIYGHGPDIVKRANASYKGYGVIYYDSTTQQLPQGYKPIQEVKGGVGQEIMNLVTIAQFLDKEMEEKSGVTGTQQGQTRPNQLNKVTEYALQQGAKISMGLIKGFLNFEGRLWSVIAEKTKIMMAAYPEVYEAIVGAEGLEVILDNMDVYLYDFGSTVKPTALFYDVDPELKAMLLAGVEQGGLPFDDALPILIQSRTDIEGAVARFVKLGRQRRKEAQEAEAQARREQLEAQQAQTEAQIAAKQDSDRNKGAEGIQKAQIGADAQRDVATINAGTQNRKTNADLLSKITSSGKQN